MSFKQQVALDGLILAVFSAVLFVMATSCQILPDPVVPYAVILPPGYQQPPLNSALTAHSMVSDAVRTPIVRKAVLALPPNVILTADIDLTQPFDGVNLYAGFTSQSLALLATFGHANVFPVNLPTNLPSLIEVRTFINWPPPYVVGSVTLDDGTTVDFTNTFYESPGAQFIFVPTNCPAIGLFSTTNGMVLAGWNSGTNLVVRQSADRITWSNLATITNQGAWTLLVSGSQGQAFWRTSQ